MSRAFQELMNKIGAAIEKRTISLPLKKAKDYEEGKYKPFFSLIDRDGELLCMWCGNRQRPNHKGEGGDIEIVRFKETGFATSMDDPKNWDSVTLKVMHHFGMQL